MGPTGHDRQLHIAGNDRGHSRAPDTHGRRTEMTENQNIVQHQIHQHRADAGNHGNKGLIGFPQSAAIGTAQGKGGQAPQHNQQILPAVGQGLPCILNGTLAVEIKLNQIPAEQQQHPDAQGGQQRTHKHLKAEGVAHTLMILRAEELGGKDTRAGGGAEYAQVKDEQKLVHNGNAVHLHRSHLAHHDVVQQGNKIGDAVLNDDGQGHRQNPAVKVPVTDISL